MKINRFGRPPEHTGVCVAFNTSIHILVDEYDENTGEWVGPKVRSLENISNTLPRPFEKFFGFGNEVFYDVKFPEHRTSYSFNAEDFEAQFLIVGAL